MPETASCRRSAIVSILAALAVAVCLLAIFGGIGIRQAYADGTENIAFSVPAKVPFAVKADGTVVGPSASAWRIKNDGTRPLRIKDVAASGFDDGSTVSAVSEAMPVASTLTRGIWSINVSRGGASLKSSVDGTIEIPVGGSAGFTWNANSPDDTKHTVSPAPMALGAVSFTLGGAEPIAFAVYSDDDKSLDFYKRLDVPEVGNTFENKVATEVYAGFETDTYASRHEVPWADHKTDIVKIDAVDRIRPVSMSYWFDMVNVENPKVTEADLSEVDTSACKSMRCLFANAKSLKRIDGLQSWDTSSCTTMRAMFGKCSELQTIDVSNWNTSKASDLSYMFQECSALQSLDVSRWDTSSCITMKTMFGKCSALQTIDVSNWNTSSCTAMSMMFCDCLSLESLDVSRWDTSKVTTFQFMFAVSVANKYMKLRTVGDLSGWNTSNVTDMCAMFQECKYLESIGNISGWDISKVTNMSGLFNGCVRLNGIGNLSGWNTSSCTTMRLMFYNCLSVESLDISRWDTSKVTTFAAMFATSGNQYMKLRTVGDLSGWNTSNVTDMDAMFQDCEYLESIGDISSWNTSKVTNMGWLFNRCVRLDGIGDLSGWNTSHNNNFESMFRGQGMTKTGMKIDVSFVKAWDVRSATNISTMFMDCTAQEVLDLSGWDISSVKDMSSIFDGMTGLRKISLPASWKWIGSTGYLPTPSSDSIPGADGKWYSVTTGRGYTSADIPSGKADTYYAVSPLQQAVSKDAKDWTLEDQEVIAENISENGEVSSAYAKAKAAMDAGTTWSMQLTDGSTLTYKIIGINHDDLADGTGKAGLTFLTTSTNIGTGMNASATNVGGWKKSELREKMNSGEIWNMMPLELQSKVRLVRKLTNNVGGGPANKNAAVTATSDRLFLLSYSEIVPTSYSWWASDYPWTSAEGTQYEAFKGKVTNNRGANPVIAFGDHWWTRSLCPPNSALFISVGRLGDPSEADPASGWGCVLPCFCF